MSKIEDPVHVIESEKPATQAKRGEDEQIVMEDPAKITTRKYSR